MSANNWTFARLEDEQLEWIRQGEHVLGADYLVAFRQEAGTRPGYVELFLEGLSAAELDESELEVLAGLEQRLQAVVVAYKRPI